MKLMRLALTGSLLLFLAACGNKGPIDPPTTTGTTTDGTTSGTTTGGSTTGGSTTGGTSGFFPSTTGGLPSTTGGLPTTTGGTTDGTTTGGSTTGGSTTGGGTGTISGTITAPSGSDLTGIIVAACPQSLTQCASGTRGQVASSGAYTISGLSATPYVVIAGLDSNGNGIFTDPEDLVGAYPSVASPQTVTPPIAGIDITMQAVGGGTDPTPSDLTGTWTGTTTTNSFGTQQTTFDLTEDNGTVSGTLTLSGGTAQFEANNPVEGTVSGSSVSLSASYTSETDSTIGVDFVYSGTVAGSGIVGTVTLNFSDGTTDSGQFSVTQGSAVTAPQGKFDAKVLSRIFENIR